MADSPGKVLSSFASPNERKASISKLGGCAGVFSQLLDRFNGRKLFPHKLLPSERPKHSTIGHTEEKLPMAKLLLIADENRIGSSRRDGDDAFQKNKNCEERRGKKSVGVVARLMGLETMPSPEPFIREKKQIEVVRNTEEVQSARKILQNTLMFAEEDRKDAKAINTRIQTLKKRTKRPHIDQLHRFEAKISSLNSLVDPLKQSSTKNGSKSHIKFLSSQTIMQVKSIEAEDPKALFLSKLPAMPSFQVESPLRSILSPSSKLLSPISPLSSKSRACLFGAAARVLEPSLRPVRQLDFHPHDIKCTREGKDMNEQKMTVLGALSAPPLVPAAERRISTSKHQLNLEQRVPSSSSLSSPSPSMFTSESSKHRLQKGAKCQATSRHVNPTSEMRAQSSSNEVSALKPLINKQGQAKNSSRVKHEKKSNSKLTSEKKWATSTSQRQEASSSNGGARLIPLRENNKASIKVSQLDSEQDDAALPVHAKEGNSNQEEAGKRSSQPIISRRQPKSTKGSSISTVSHPVRAEKSLQNFKKSLQASSESVNQEGGAKSSSPNMSSSKSTTSSAQSKSVTSAQVKGVSPFIRPSAKRKASNHLPKPRGRVEVLAAVGGDFIYGAQNEGVMQSLGGNSPSICKEQNNFYHSDLDTPVVCSIDGDNATNSSDLEAVVHTRVRARWDIGDETKRNITKNCISCWKSDSPVADYHSGSNSTRGEDALQTKNAAAGILEELLLSLNVSPSPLREDGSNILFSESKRSCEDFMGLSADSSTDLSSFLQGAEQGLQSDSFSPKEDTSVRDCESVSDSLCAEEFEQPSPISILESPFQDSASISSDSFEASHGRTQWEGSANEILDCMSIMGKQIEDVKIHDAQTMADGKKFMDVNICLHCRDQKVLDMDAIIDTVIENEDAYVKMVLEAAAFSAENAIWERLALSGALLDPAVFYQFEKHTQHFTWRATMPSNLCIQNDSEVSPCRMRACMGFRSLCRESALQKRKLLFDCIEEALRLSLELASQSYGFSVLYIQLPTAYFLKEVYRQIDEWKWLAISMNLDDMMKMEINTGMGLWFKFGDEVEKITENIEAMIIRSLMDELMEGLIETPASCVCS